MLLGSAAVALTACSGGAVSKGGVLTKPASRTLAPISIRRGRGKPRFPAAFRTAQSVTTQPGPGGYSFQTDTSGYVNLYKPDGTWAAQTDTSQCTDDAFVLMLTGSDGSQSTASVPTPWNLAADTTYNGSITGSASGSAPVPYQLRYDSASRASTVTLGPNAWWKVTATGAQGQEQYTYTDSAGGQYQIPTAVLAAMEERRSTLQVAGGGPQPQPAPTVVGTQGPCTAEKYAQCDQWRTLIWSTWALALVAISLAFIGCIGLLAWWTIGAGTAICAGLLAIALAAFTAMVFSTRSQFLLVCSNCQMSV
ncbi:MAG: hypothetical protein JO083_03905 [Candidatus Eremiobacteraeota bacterium]|nr:hypothetical protein [Candidatus Eremiobacteraeota bacterium]